MIHRHLKLFSSFIYFLAVVIAMPFGQVRAQEFLEEVVVTAQRREQTTMDVPISMTAYSADLIEQNNWRGAKDFILMTPNVAFDGSDDQGSKNGNIAIRGLSDLTTGQRERIIQSRAAVGYNVDEFSVGAVASGSANPPLNDIERIEILRGPQGTYFGRNATGGAINIITKKPDENRMAKIQAGVGDFGRWEVGGLVNLPLADNLFFRGGVSYDLGDGVVDNLSPAGNDPEYDNLNARFAVRWQPENWTIDLVGQVIEESEDNPGLIPTGLRPFGPVVGPFGRGDPSSPALTCGRGAALFFQNGNDDKNCENQDTFMDISNNIVTLRLEYAAERFTVTSISGRLGSDFDQLDDLENTGLDIFYRTNDYESESWSQELRITSASDWELFGRPFTWLVGANYYNDQYDVFNTIHVGEDAVVPFAAFLSVPGDHPNENQQFVEREGWAVFFDFSLDILENVTFSFGGRYSEDDDTQYWREVYTSFGCGPRPVIDGVPGPLAAGCAPRDDQIPEQAYTVGATDFITGGRFQQTLQTDTANDGTDFSPRLALNWNVNDDHTVYVTWSQGYRAAGTRAAPDSALLTRAIQLTGVVPPGIETRSVFDKEKVDNYEIGWKGFLNDRRTQFELAIFRMDWKDMQARFARFVCPLADGAFVESTSPAAAGCVSGPVPDNRVQNAKSAETQGVELTVQSLVGDQFQLGGSFGYLDSEFTSFRDAVQGDLTGLELPNAPELSISLMGQYNWNYGDIDGYLRMEAVNRSGTTHAFETLLVEQFPGKTRDYTVVNLRAGADWKQHRFYFGVANLLDEDYVVGLDNLGGAGFGVRPNPRMINFTWSMTMDF